MLRIVHSIPNECIDCGAPREKISDLSIKDRGNTVFCYICGVIMVIQDQEEDAGDLEITASFTSCPHCNTLDEIQVANGEEWCNGCGLDPNKLDYSTQELSTLWKKGSGIRAFMGRGVPKTTSRLYRFLINFCGPHCVYAEDCPQSTKNFTICMKEEIENDSGILLVETKMGSKKKQKKARKIERQRIEKEKKRAVVQFSPSGWYAKVVECNETKDPQKSTYTGGGSRT